MIFLDTHSKRTSTMADITTVPRGAGTEGLATSLKDFAMISFDMQSLITSNIWLMFTSTMAYRALSGISDDVKKSSKTHLTY